MNIMLYPRLQPLRQAQINIYRKISNNAVKSANQAALKQEDSKQQWDQAKPFKDIPGPKIWPIIGSAPDFLFNGKFAKLSALDIHHAMRRNYGDISRLTIGKDQMVFTFNPEDIELVYRTEGVWPERRPLETFNHYRSHVRPDVYSETGGLLNEQGALWHDVRTKVNPTMMQPRMTKQYITPVEEVVDEFVERMKKLRNSDNEMPEHFLNELNKWSLESIARIAMDTRLGCLKDDLKPDSEPQKMIESVHQFFELSFQLEVLPSPWRIISTPAYRRLMKCFDIMTDVSLKYVNAAAERIDNNPNKSTDEESVLEKLLKIDRSVATVMVMDMLLAGIDTTSSSVAFLLYFLATNQSKQDILREEIKTILPNKDSKLNATSLSNIPYLKACMKESARCSPITLGNLRKAGQDVVLSGYRIPKGTHVVLGHTVLSGLETQFPKPNEFIPERWLTGRKSNNLETEASKCPVDHSSEEVPSAKTAHSFTFMPFGFGPRMCIGRRFAELEIEIFMMKLLRNYRIEWHHEKMEVRSTLLNGPKNPLQYKMVEI